MKLVINRDDKVNKELLNSLIAKHQVEINKRLNKLKNAYLGNYAIFKDKAKPEYKPDNRASTPFAKNIVDSFTGYFDGIPLECKHENKDVMNVLKRFNDDNNTKDIDFELIKNACIYGSSNELIYQDENGETKLAVLSLFNSFVVYSNDVKDEIVLGVHYNIDDKMNIKGNLYTVDEVFEFKGVNNSVETLTLSNANVYNQVPINEYIFNKERQGIFEQVLSLIDVYNRTMSDKANDVEYFSDAYLSIIGAELEQEDLDHIRDNRIINLTPELDTTQAKVEFIGKPNADSVQEHLLERLRDDIYNGSMVANINDDTFGNASGISLRYKLLPQENLAKTLERNLTKSLKNRYKLFMSLETNIPTSLKDEYKSMEFVFKRNQPIDLLDEADTLTKLKGLVSEETLLSLATFIPDAKQELEKMDVEEKNNQAQFMTDSEKNDLITSSFNKQGVVDHEEE